MTTTSAPMTALCTGRVHTQGLGGTRPQQAWVRCTIRPLSVTLGAVALDLNRRLARSQSVIPRTVGLFSLGYGEMTRGPGWRQVPMNQIGHDGLAECAR